MLWHAKWLVTELPQSTGGKLHLDFAQISQVVPFVGNLIGPVFTAAIDLQIHTQTETRIIDHGVKDLLVSARQASV